jgi:DNA-binding SARP family transcriptional activator
MSVLVRLMGAFSVEVDGRMLDQGDFRRRSAAAVVKILALAPHRRMHREQVMDSDRLASPTPAEGSPTEPSR